MRNLIGALWENSWAQLTMNSSASSSRSFSMKGEGSIELKSWFMSRSFRLMVRGCPRSEAVVSESERRIGESLLSSVLPNIGCFLLFLEGHPVRRLVKQGRHDLT